MNNLSATGNAGNDAEVRFTSDGTAIASWSIALASGYGKNEKTTWLRCNMFGKRGETIAQYIKKGSQVGVNGEISLNTYKGKDGAEKTSLECNVQAVTLLGKKDSNGAGSAPQNKGAGNTNPADFDDDESVPF